MDKSIDNSKIVRLNFRPIPEDVKKRMEEQRVKMNKKARFEFIEHYLDNIRDDLIDSYAMNGIDIFSEEGMDDLGFLVEAHNAFLHRRMGMRHYMDEYIDKVIKMSQVNKM